MTHYYFPRELEREAYRLPFHVRVPSSASEDALAKARAWSLERMRGQLEKQGWTYVMLDPRPRGPLPVVPVKGVGKRPERARRRPGVPSGSQEPDDSLWRVSTLPGITRANFRELTDEVEWEYVAIFQRPVIPTAHEIAPGGSDGRHTDN